MSEDRLHIDFESRSRLDLTKVGTVIYANDPSTAVWCFAWAFNAEKVALWEPGQPIPRRIIQHIASGGVVSGFSVQFEFFMWSVVLPRQLGLKELPLMDYHQLDCTQARAVVMGLPRSLDALAGALDQAHNRMHKDLAGRRLMLQMARPRHVAPDGTCTWWDDPDRRHRLGLYCMQDVEVERYCEHYLRPLTAQHREYWDMDFRMNFIRGIQIDTHLVEQSRDVLAVAAKHANRQLRRITDGACTGIAQLQGLRAWLAAQGVDTPSLDKEHLQALLDNEDVTGKAREALQLRQDFGKASLAKIAQFERRTADGRMHGMLLFNGAGPGRWTGQGAQLHNLPRPELNAKSVEYVVRVLRDTYYTAQEKYDLLEMVFGAVLPAMADAIRGFIIAPEKRKLLIRDFSQIEGRCIARIAGERWKIDAYKAFDAGHGPDLYRMAASKAFGMRVEDVDDRLRQAGKVMELSCLGPDTRVVTSNGVKRIVDVLITDLLWDGEEWTHHQGLIFQGIKPVLNLMGVAITPNHLIWTGSRWRPANELVAPDSLSLALAAASANLPSFVMNMAQKWASKAYTSSANAGQTPTALATPILPEITAPPAARNVAERAPFGFLAQNLATVLANSQLSISQATARTGLSSSCNAIAVASPFTATSTTATVLQTSAAIAAKTARHLKNLKSRFASGPYLKSDKPSATALFLRLGTMLKAFILASLRNALAARRHASLKTLILSATSLVPAPAVTNPVQEWRALSAPGRGKRYPTRNTVIACKTGSVPLSGAALPQLVHSILIMVGAGLRFTRSGSKIGSRFLPISPRCRAGTIPNWNWIGSKTTRITRRAISSSSLKLRTWPTGAPLAANKSSLPPLKPETKTLSQKSLSLSPVYDIAHAGPRNRFTILTDSGPLIVHNCGFGGGAPALAKMARKYGINLSDYYEVVSQSVSRAVVSKAEWGWTTFGFKTGIKERTWLTAEMLKLAWRETNPMIVQLWDKLDEAAICAVREPKKVFSYRGIAFQLGKIKGIPYLMCQLPSSRILYYPYATWTEQTTPWGAQKESVRFMGIHPITRKWASSHGRGGLWAENITQGDAFDFIAAAMLRCENAGFPPVLSVHDENVAEAPDDADDAEYGRLMAVRPPWARGMPLAADGFSGPRYAKK